MEIEEKLTLCLKSEESAQLLWCFGVKGRLFSCPCSKVVTANHLLSSTRQVTLALLALYFSWMSSVVRLEGWHSVLFVVSSWSRPTSNVSRSMRLPTASYDVIGALLELPFSRGHGLVTAGRPRDADVAPGNGSKAVPLCYGWHGTPECQFLSTTHSSLPWCLQARTLLCRYHVCELQVRMHRVEELLLSPSSWQVRCVRVCQICQWKKITAQLDLFRILWYSLSEAVYSGQFILIPECSGPWLNKLLSAAFLQIPL